MWTCVCLADIPPKRRSGIQGNVALAFSGLLEGGASQRRSSQQVNAGIHTAQRETASLLGNIHMGDRYFLQMSIDQHLSSIIALTNLNHASSLKTLRRLVSTLLGLIHIYL